MDFEGEVDNLQLQHLAGGDIVSHPPLHAPTDDLLFIISDRIIQVYSTTTGEQTNQLTGASSKLIAMEFELKNDIYLVACTESGEVLRWIWRTGSLENTIKLQLPDNTKFYSFNLINLYGNSDTACAFVIFKHSGSTMHWQVIDTTTGRKLSVPCNMRLTNQQPIVDVDAKHFKTIAIAQKMYIFFIDYSNWQWKRYKSALQTPITAVRVHPKENAVATGDEMGKIFLWRQFMDQQTVGNSLYHWHHTAITSLSFSATGSSLYSSGMEAVLVKWNVEEPNLRTFLPRMSSVISHVAVSRDNTKVAVCTADNCVHLIGVDGIIKCTIQEFTYIIDDKTGNDKFPVGLRLDPRTNTLALNGRTGHLQFYSAYTNSLLYNMDIVAQNQLSIETEKILYNIRVTKAAFNIDWMATGEVYNDQEHLPELRLKFWKYQKESQSYTLNSNIELPHEGGFKAIEFSNEYQVDNLLCATVGEDNTIKMWSLEESDNIYKKGKVWYCVATTNYKSMPIESISFSQDGSLLAAGFGNTLCIYKPDNLKLKAALTGSAGNDGYLQKAQVRIPKHNVNGSRNELIEQRKKVMKLFTNLLESNEETLIKEIQKSVADNNKESTPLEPLEVVDDKQKQLLYNKILAMHELNLFQKVLLYQKLNISCKVHPHWQQTVASYLRNNVVNIGINEKYTSLNEKVRRLSVGDRFKAKYRLLNFGKRRLIYDQEINSKLVPILSVLNLNETTKQPRFMNKKVKESNNETQADDTIKVIPPLRAMPQITQVQFATGDCAHLVIVCTQYRILIWNLLTLRLQSVLKLSVEHLSLDPQTNLIAAFTKNKELHVFQPNVPLPIYQRRNVPTIHGAVWLARRYPKPRSINLDWQAQSTLYFLADNKEIMYLGSSDDAATKSAPHVSFNHDVASEILYSTFGTFATKSNSDKITNSRQNGPLVIGVSGKNAVKSLINMSTHTMPPLSLLCGEFVKTLVKPAADSSRQQQSEDFSKGQRSKNAYDKDGDVTMNGNVTSHSDTDDDENDDDDKNTVVKKDKTKQTSVKRKFLLAKSEELSKGLTHSSNETHLMETQLRRINEQKIEIEF